MAAYDVAVLVCCTATLVVMIEVIVRDGCLAEIELKIPPRVVSSSPLSSGDQPYEIGDLITLADGEPAVIIGSKEDIFPIQSWKQTVFIDDSRKPKPRLNINLATKDL
jgi:hypothetical protein